MIDRIAALIKQYKVNKHLIINFDQTGVNLVPSSKTTYEKEGSKQVGINYVDDKRQITAIIASTPTGHLLPIQLIYQGTTDKCHAEATHDVVRAGFHLTHSDNHWSNIDTMKQYMERVIQPFISDTIKHYKLPENSYAIIVLDCWSVHKSKQFREYIQKTHKNLFLVFIPPNCTAKLQVADVALNYSFKHLIKQQYEDWATNEVFKQLQANLPVKIVTSMEVIKPLCLDWCYNSWDKLRNRQELIMAGWIKCMNRIRDPYDEKVQEAAFDKILQQQLLAYGFVPKEDEEEEKREYYECITDTDSDEDELDPLKRRVYGSRKSTRAKKTVNNQSYMIATDKIILDGESDAELR